MKKTTGKYDTKVYGKQNLDAVERVLREAGEPLHVREIIEEAARLGIALPTKSQTPDTAIHRDLACDVKHNPASRFVKLDVGLYALRERPVLDVVRHQDPAALGFE